MFDLERESSRHIPEPDLVPILDGLVSVIFFLLLSISFIGLTKLTVPPSATSVVTDTKTLPLSPRVKVRTEKQNLVVELSWLGSAPDRKSISYQRKPERSVNEELITKVGDLVKEFKEKFPQEKTMQLVMQENLNYQEMIAVMDGIRPFMEDIVLNSYKEVD